MDLFDFFTSEEGSVGISPDKFDVCRDVTRQVLHCVAETHAKFVSHRDLKPENFLVSRNRDGKFDVKICDFGLATIAEPDSILPCDDFCGSPGFFAPEMICGDGYNGLQADVFSVGAIILELVLSHDNFTDEWMPAYDFDLLHKPDEFRAAIGARIDAVTDRDEFPAALRDLLKKTLTLEEKQRLTAIELM